MDPYTYLVGKLAQVEVALEDFEAVAEETPNDQEQLARLEEIRTQLVETLSMLEAEQPSPIGRRV